MARKVTTKQENVGSVKEDDGTWELSDLSAQSTTNLESDTGHGAAAIVRMFEFAANPEAFRIHTPSKQELFNAHLKGIEVMLWRDGLRVMTDIEPKLTISKKKDRYRIWVGAEPARGHILRERPQTLGEILHGRD